MNAIMVILDKHYVTQKQKDNRHSVLHKHSYKLKAMIKLEVFFLTSGLVSKSPFHIYETLKPW